MAEVLSTFILPIGSPIPPFHLQSPTGPSYSHLDLFGPNGLLVVFACNHCPFVIHLAQALGSLADELAQLGIHTVAINSNDSSAYPADAPSLMPTFAHQSHWNFPYLVDPDQSVAKQFFAACTPDFFLFDGQHSLYYNGQFDSSRPHASSPTGLDLRNAAHSMLQSLPPTPNPYPSSGCNIKWLPNRLPPWFTPKPKPSPLQ